jgi:hypothetical protein
MWRKKNCGLSVLVGILNISHGRISQNNGEIAYCKRKIFENFLEDVPE